MNDEPLSPACAGCREPKGTCFPGPCKRWQDAQVRERARLEREAALRRFLPLVSDGDDGA